MAENAARAFAARTRNPAFESPFEAVAFQPARSFLRVSGEGPESGRISTEPSQAISDFRLSYSSRTAWKLLPPNPKALTPARLGCFLPESQGIATAFK